MPNKCQITNKTAKTGNNVSHSHRKTKKLFKANLQNKRILNPATGKYMRITISTKALKTLAKWQAAGKKYDLRKIINK